MGPHKQGFDAEWRVINLVTVDGDLINRCEIFDEADLDAALARFDELSRPAPQLENAASRVYERLHEHFAARDWDALTETLAEDHYGDDRRRVVNAGIQRGRDAEIANLRATADIGVTVLTITPIAIRGDRLALCRTRGATSGPTRSSRSCSASSRSTPTIGSRARVMFDLDDIDAAFEELDARYLAGEAAAHAHTWSLIMQAYAAFNRRELPATTPDWVNIDHRRGTGFAPGDAIPYVRASWDVAPDINIYIEAVHRLSDLGAVVTHAANGTSQEGFDAEWREITISDVRRRPDQPLRDLRRGRPRRRAREVRRAQSTGAAAGKRGKPESTSASWRIFAARDWDAMAEMLADDTSQRRSPSGRERRGPTRSGCRDRRLRAAAEVGVQEHDVDRHCDPRRAPRPQSRPLPRTATSGPTRFAPRCSASSRSTRTSGSRRRRVRPRRHRRCLRGTRRSLPRRRSGRPRAHVVGDCSEPSPRSTGTNYPRRRPDWVNIDHRRGTAFAPGELTAYIRATWDLTPDVRPLHRGRAPAEQSWSGRYPRREATSQEGFDAEWRMINLLTVEGDLINRCEIFDEADLDAALASFDELSRQATPQLENVATRALARATDAFNRRDLDGDLAVATADGRYEDRRIGLR